MSNLPAVCSCTLLCGFYSDVLCCPLGVTCCGATSQLQGVCQTPWKQKPGDLSAAWPGRRVLQSADVRSWSFAALHDLGGIDGCAPDLADLLDEWGKF